MLKELEKDVSKIIQQISSFRYNKIKYLMVRPLSHVDSILPFSWYFSMILGSFKYSGLIQKKKNTVYRKRIPQTGDQDLLIRYHEDLTIMANEGLEKCRIMRGIMKAYIAGIGSVDGVWLADLLRAFNS